MSVSDEVVLCIHAEAATAYNPHDIVSTSHHVLLPRSECEHDERYRQLIPYCAIRWHGKYLMYDRAGAESRLHGMSSIGIGGHINRGETVYDGLKRELFEEVQVKACIKKYLGSILHYSTPVSRVHMGLAYLIECNDTPVPQSELLNARWKTLEECESETESLEEWSKELLAKLMWQQRAMCLSAN